MILFENEAKARDEYFGTSAKEIAEFVKRYSVKLDGGRFIGSGVMVARRSDPNYVYILTAKHNLTVRGKDDNLGVPAWSDAGAISTLHETFRQKVTIRAGDISAPISNIFYFGKDWNYDVCCLASNDPKLYGLWGNTGSKLAPLLWRAGADYRQEALLGLFAKDSQEELQKRYFFVQTGFGCNRYLPGTGRTQDRIDSNVRGTFNHRQLILTNFWKVAHDRDEDTDRVMNGVAAARASETATSAPGDSGGGVFAMEKGSKDPWMLAGVNLGANMHRDADNPIQTAASAENNVFTVLATRVLYPTEDGLYTVRDGNIVGAKQDEAFAHFWDGREAVSVVEESEVAPEPLISG